MRKVSLIFPSTMPDRENRIRVIIGDFNSCLENGGNRICVMTGNLKIVLKNDRDIGNGNGKEKVCSSVGNVNVFPGNGRDIGNRRKRNCEIIDNFGIFLVKRWNGSDLTDGGKRI
jgi:hypothetical protein